MLNKSAETTEWMDFAESIHSRRQKPIN